MKNNKIFFLIVSLAFNISSMENVTPASDPVASGNSEKSTLSNNKSAQPAYNQFIQSDSKQENGYTYFSTNVDPVKDPKGYRETYKSYIFSNLRNKNKPEHQELKEEDRKPKVWSGDQVSGNPEKLKLELITKKLMLEEILKQVAIVMQVMFFKGPQEFQVPGRKYTLKDFYYTRGLVNYLEREKTQIDDLFNKMGRYVNVGEIIKKLGISNKIEAINAQFESENKSIKELTDGPKLKEGEKFVYNKEFLDKEKNVLDLLLKELQNLLTSSDLRCVLSYDEKNKNNYCEDLLENKTKGEYNYKNIPSMNNFNKSLTYYSNELVDSLQKLSASYATNDIQFYNNYIDLNVLYRKGFLGLKKNLDKIIISTGSQAELEKKALIVLLDLYDKIFKYAIDSYKPDFEDNKVIIEAIKTLFSWDKFISNINDENYLNSLEKKWSDKNDDSDSTFFNVIKEYIRRSGSVKLATFWGQFDDDNKLGLGIFAINLLKSIKKEFNRQESNVSSNSGLDRFALYKKYVSDFQAEIDKPYVWYSTQQKRAKELLQELINLNAYIIQKYNDFLQSRQTHLKDETNFAIPEKEKSRISKIAQEFSNGAKAALNKISNTLSDWSQKLNLTKKTTI